MITSVEIVALLAAHYFADYGIQAWVGWGARKHNDATALIAHGATYFVTILIAGDLLGYGLSIYLWYWAWYNTLAHIFVDKYTSKLTNWLHAQNKIKLFWNVHGLDQFLHVPALLITWNHFVG